MSQTLAPERRISLFIRLLAKRTRPAPTPKRDPLFMFADAPGVDLHPRGRL